MVQSYEGKDLGSKNNSDFIRYLLLSSLFKPRMISSNHGHQTVSINARNSKFTIENLKTPMKISRKIESGRVTKPDH